MYNNAVNAYEAIERTTTSGRETEARVLTQAAQRLRMCQKKWHDDNQRELLDEALKYNQKIWTIFQSELGKADNPLPDNIKQDLLRLSGFVDKRTFEIMAFPESDKLSILININDNISAGLRA